LIDAWQAWRDALWVRKFRQWHAVRRLHRRMPQSTALMRKKLRTAAVLHKLNVARRTLRAWHRMINCMLVQHHRARFWRLRSFYDQWTQKWRQRDRIRRGLQRWQSRLAQVRTMQHFGMHVQRARLREGAWQAWRRSTHRIRLDAAQKLAVYCRSLQAVHKMRCLLAIVSVFNRRRQLLRRVVNDQTERLARTVFERWLLDCRQSVRARRMSQRRTMRSCWQHWQTGHHEKRDRRAGLMIALQAWLQGTRRRIATRTFLATALQRHVALYHPSAALWSHTVHRSLSNRSDMEQAKIGAISWLHWRHRAVKQRTMRRLAEDVGRRRLANLARHWRLLAYERRLQKPHTWCYGPYLRTWRQSTHLVNDRRQLLAVRLADQRVGRTFLDTALAYRRWEQLFQVRKIEEHLCRQNLKVWQLHCRQILLCAWRERLWVRMFRRRIHLPHTRREHLARWLGETRRLGSERLALKTHQWLSNWRQLADDRRAWRFQRAKIGQRVTYCWLKLVQLVQHRRQDVREAIALREHRLLRGHLFRWLRRHRRTRCNPFLSCSGRETSASTTSEHAVPAVIVTTRPLLSVPVDLLGDTPVKAIPRAVSSQEVGLETSALETSPEPLPWFPKVHHPSDMEEQFYSPLK
jgi:hypothetical protein